MRSPILRALLVVPVLVVLTCAWFTLRWCIGNTMSPYAINMDTGGLDVARAAVRLAPDDPQAHWSIAEIEKRSLAPEELAASIKEYEEAASRSPNDYRLWMDLGRALSQAGDAAGGEQALRRAVELAPSYAWPRWYLGNALVRRGKLDEGITELRFAASRNQELRSPVFDLAWHIYGEDVRIINEKLADSTEARAQLTTYLLGHKRIEDALKLWDTLNSAEKRNEHVTGEALMNTLLQAKQYHAAIKLYATFARQGVEIPQVGQLQNNGFESDNGIVTNGSVAGADAFGWHIKSVPQAQIAIDARNHHDGNRSLRVVFNAPANVSFTNIAQFVALAPATHYRLQCSIRTKDLRSAGTPILQVVSAADNSILGSSAPLSIGTSEWQQITIDFATDAKTEGVTLLINRAPCNAGDSVCPIFGTVWYDDFNLQRLGAGSGSNNAARR